MGPVDQYKCKWYLLNTDYADDLALEVGAMNENTPVVNTNICLERIGTWIKEHGLSVTPDKF